MPQLDALKRHYASLEDQRIRSLVEQDLSTLSPESLPVLRAELANRGFVDLAQAVSVQVDGVKPEELDAIVTWLRRSPCPICGRQEDLLNGCIVHSLYRTDFVLACISCLNAAVEDASTRNTAGCLFAPLGVFFGTRGQARNSKGLEAARRSEPSPALLEHVQRHAATLAVAMRTACR